MLTARNERMSEDIAANAAVKTAEALREGEVAPIVVQRSGRAIQGVTL